MALLAGLLPPVMERTGCRGQTAFLIASHRDPVGLEMGLKVFMVKTFKDLIALKSISIILDPF